MALLDVKDLHAGYGPIEVLKGISLSVNEGEIVTVIGANGAGKTTTLMTISRLHQSPRREHRVRRQRSGRACQPTRSSSAAWPSRRRVARSFRG